MDSKIPTKALKWYHPRRLGLTREYCGGIVAGFGIGIATIALAADHQDIRPGWTLVVIAGLVFMSIGSYMARSSRSNGLFRSPEEGAEQSSGDEKNSRKCL